MCRSGCPTQDHANWGECCRAANIRVGYAKSAAGLDYTTEKHWQSELDLYQRARSQGIQPNGTTQEAVTDALRVSDRLGRAYDGNTEPPARTLLDAKVT